jgi:lysophospholipase L1-like esterase
MSIFPTRAQETVPEFVAALAGSRLSPYTLSRSVTQRNSSGRGLATMAGLGLLAGLSSAVVGLLGQAWSTTRSIERAALAAALADGTLVPPPVLGATAAQQRVADHLVHIRLPQGDGVYLPGGTRLQADSEVESGRPVIAAEMSPFTLVMLGDSTSVGYGARTADELPGVIIARGIARHLDRPVHLRSHGLTGACTADLPRQLQLCLADAPDLVVILIGGNDLRDRVPPWRSAAQLGHAVRNLTDLGIPVVVGTCPDFGAISAIPQPLRSLLSTWSLRLAALQERAVTAAGGRPVALARLVSPQFVGNPDLFAADRFHPSGAGYGRAMQVLLPAAIASLEAAAEGVADRIDPQGRQDGTPDGARLSA